MNTTELGKDQDAHLRTFGEQSQLTWLDFEQVDLSVHLFSFHCSFSKTQPLEHPSGVVSYSVTLKYTDTSNWTQNNTSFSPQELCIVSITHMQHKRTPNTARKKKKSSFLMTEIRVLIHFTL